MNIREENWLDEAPNLTPMIDVVFLLLIFFMVATTFLDPEREIDIELPTAETGVGPQEESAEFVVNVEEDGSILVEGSRIDYDGLVNRLKAVALHDPKTAVTIRGHRRAEHQAVVHVMDACGVAGLTNLAVGTTAEQG